MGVNYGSDDAAFSFLPLPRRPGKPRQVGRTEVRGPFSSNLGPRAWADLLDLAGPFVDAFKFPGGSFALTPRSTVASIIDAAHQHDVEVSSGGFLEWVLMRAPHLVPEFLAEARALGFDTIEVSTGFLTIRPADVVQLVRDVRQAGFKVKPEIHVRPGAGAYLVTPERLAASGTTVLGPPIELARRCLEAGADMIMIESEAITEQVEQWDLSVIPPIVDALGLENVMFEAAEPEAFDWYIRHHGPDVNLFIDHSQVLLLESHRVGTWSDNATWGRVVNYPPRDPAPS